MLMGTWEAVLLSALSGHPPTSRHGIAVEPQGPVSEQSSYPQS